MNKSRIIKKRSGISVKPYELQLFSDKKSGLSYFTLTDFKESDNKEKEVRHSFSSSSSAYNRSRQADDQTNSKKKKDESSNLKREENPLNEKSTVNIPKRESRVSKETITSPENSVVSEEEKLKEDNKTVDKDDYKSKSSKLNIEEEKKKDKKSDNSKQQRRDIIPLKRHLEVLEAERNKYQKKGYNEGYNNGMMEAKEKFYKEYEAKKEDYLDILSTSYVDAINEIRKIRDVLYEIDKKLPEIVLNYVKRIVGIERKINDKIVVSVIKSKIDKFKSLGDIRFYVNPDDVEYVKYEFPGYEVFPDKTVNKGGFKVKTKIGDVVFDIDKLIDNLEEMIYEELKVAESD
ncbi:MAG: FliH/SctL family protein [Deferribacterota bacterium]|nr:FliH/SctL family protein [Deferribacterota bacterium]